MRALYSISSRAAQRPSLLLALGKDSLQNC